MLDLIIDGMGGTEIVRFDGNPASLKDYTYLDQDLTALASRLLPGNARQLIIGPGGGVDILQAVRAGRTDITVVEINPLIVSVVNRKLGWFSGRPYDLPGVRLVLENGRTFIKRTTDTFDLISLTWVDTGGSATALAFSENYLYTVEAVPGVSAAVWRRTGTWLSCARLAWAKCSGRIRCGGSRLRGRRSRGRESPIPRDTCWSPPWTARSSAGRCASC